jgi:hypothetical protein
MEGKDGSFMGHDAKGRVLRISRAKDGALEIRHLAEKTSDDELEDVTGSGPPVSYHDGALRRWNATARTEDHIPALAAYQKQLDEHYGNR